MFSLIFIYYYKLFTQLFIFYILFAVLSMTNAEKNLNIL